MRTATSILFLRTRFISSCLHPPNNRFAFHPSPLRTFSLQTGPAIADHPPPTHASRKRSSPLAIASVSRRNFWFVLEKFKEELPKADFVAIDMEMSGISINRQVSEPSACEMRYQMLKELAEEYAVLQVGISLFKWSFNKFIAYPYNFYVFPRNELPLELQPPNILFQASSLGFLAEHQFDFNLCIRDGISYLSREQEAEARAQLGLALERDRSKAKQHGISMSLTASSDIIFFERTRVRLSKWHEEIQRDLHATASANVLNQSKSTQTNNVLPRNSISDVLADTMAATMFSHDFACVTNSKMAMGLIPRPSLILELDDDHQVQLVQQVLRQHFHDLVSVAERSNSSKRKMQIFYTKSREDLVLLEREVARQRKQTVEDQIYEAVGFRHVIDALIGSGKPVIGHNCALDFAHMHSKFISPLPLTVAEFSSSLLSLFPFIIDTKCILKTEPRFQNLLGWNTTLGYVYSRMFNNLPTLKKTHDFPESSTGLGGLDRVEIVIAADVGRYAAASCLQFKHEAGYDAFMTGSVFAQLCHLLQVEFSIFLDSVFERSAIASYRNHLYLGHYGSMILDLNSGREATGLKPGCQSSFSKGAPV